MEKLVTPSVLLFGASGLVGGFVLEQLINDMTVLKITVFTRKSLSVTSQKVQQIITDFKNLKDIQDYFKGASVLYCCIGTTIRKAKTKDAFKAVDYDLPVNLARIANEMHVEKFIALSSIGADAESSNFYFRTKGEMERDVAKHQFKKLAFLRPSFLIGNRVKYRFGERMVMILFFLFKGFLIGKFKKYRPISAQSVAKAMISASFSLNNNRVYESEELIWMGS